MEILAVENLNFKYSLGKEKALKDVSFSVSEGDFVVLCGPTACGKSTLLRMLKKELSPAGDKTGSIKLFGKSYDEISERESASLCGYVMQKPEQQLVTDKVWHELAFGLENLGVPSDIIRRRVWEMAAYFGIEDWFDKDVAKLSGGQKQLLNLASVMLMQPKLLLLDEPTSQLDPIAAEEFLNTVKRLNKEMGISVILVEHRLDTAISLANKMMVMEYGKLILQGEPSAICKDLQEYPHIFQSMPMPIRLFNELKGQGTCPLTIADGRKWINENYKKETKASLNFAKTENQNELALEISEGWMRYEKNSPDILRGSNLKVFEGDIFCILGGNGSGKTTLLSVASGINKVYSGKVKLFGKEIKDYKVEDLYGNTVALLPQDVQTMFLKNTVREELSDAEDGVKLIPFDFTYLLDKHPYDLSGGEQQLLALAKVLAKKPRMLLLDEPLKGVDSYTQAEMIKTLFALNKQGITIIIVTHDAEFAAEISTHCALCFRGEISPSADPVSFFKENSFYTTAISKMTRDSFDSCVRLSDAIKLCQGI